MKNSTQMREKTITALRMSSSKAEMIEIEKCMEHDASQGRFISILYIEHGSNVVTLHELGYDIREVGLGSRNADYVRWKKGFEKSDHGYR